MSSIYDVLSSPAYDILLYMKNYNIPIKFSQLAKDCKISPSALPYHLRRLQEHCLINKKYPKIYRPNARMEYKISPKGVDMLKGFEKNIMIYYNMEGEKESLITFND